MNGRLSILLFSLLLTVFAGIAAADTGGTGWEMRVTRIKNGRSQTARQQGNASRYAEDHSQNEKNVRTPVAEMPVSATKATPAPTRRAAGASPLCVAPPKVQKLFLLHRVILI